MKKEEKKSNFRRGKTSLAPSFIKTLEWRPNPETGEVVWKFKIKWWHPDFWRDVFRPKTRVLKFKKPGKVRADQR